VEPGIYSVEFSKPGFETFQSSGVEVATAKEVVLNLTLSVAGSATAVNVEGATVGIQLSRASPTIERRFERTVLDSIPMTGAGLREITALALLAPAVAVMPNGTSANGQRTAVNTLLLDGVENKDPQWSFPIVRITPEMVGEVHVQTSAYSAEFGR